MKVLICLILLVPNSHTLDFNITNFWSSLESNDFFSIVKDIFTNQNSTTPVGEALNNFTIYDVLSKILNTNIPNFVQQNFLTKPSVRNETVNNFNMFYNSFQELLNQLTANFLRDLSYKENKCIQDFNKFFKAIRDRKKWAYQMLDASGKLQTGFLYGNTISYGDYDECIDIESDVNIRGQYCTAFLIPKIILEYNKNNSDTNNESVDQMDYLNVLKFATSICVPSSCTVNDLQSITNTIEETMKLDLHIQFNEQMCSYKDIKRAVPRRSVIALAIFASIAAITIFATVCDVFALDNYGGILKCFSLYCNGKKLFSTKLSNDALGCLNGLRVISMMWIVIGHRFILTSNMPAVNSVKFLKQIGDWYSYPIIGIGFAVDTFFVVSGLLVVYLYMTMAEKGQNLSMLSFYIHRILRLTPALAMMVLVYSCLVNLLESEPFPVLDMVIGDQCRRKWWSTLLYVNNYANPNDMCMAQSWYLGIDTQLYFLAPFILIPLRKAPNITLFLMAMITLTSIGGAFEVSWNNSFGATYMNQGVEEYKYLYTPTHIRAPVWLLGASLGYLIYKKKEKGIKISTLTASFLWITALLSLLVVLYVQSFFIDTEYDVFSSSLFNALARPLWGLGVCLVIFLCCFGYGGLINDFLSNPIFNFLIRINYSMYLVHMLILYLLISGSMKASVYLSLGNVFHDFWGDYAVSVMVAILWTLMFESPVIALEKYLKTGRSHYNIKENKRKVINCESIVIK